MSGINIGVGDLFNGGSIFETSGGVVYAVVGTSAGPVIIYKNVDGTPTQEENISVTTIHGSGPSWARNHAAIDSNDFIHIISVPGAAGATMDVAYRVFDTSDDTWVGAGWEECADYVFGVSPYAGGRIVIDSNDKPHVIFQAKTTYHGSDFESVQYVEKTGASWTEPVQVNVETTNMHYKAGLGITSTDKLHAYYYDSTDNYITYRENSGGTWGSEDQDLNVLGDPFVVQSANVIEDGTTDNTHGLWIFYDSPDTDIWLKEKTNAAANTGYSAYYQASYAGWKTDQSYMDSAHLLVYAEITGDKIVLRRDEGSGFGSEIEVETSVGAIRGVAVSHSEHNQNADKLHILYEEDDDGDVWYTAYEFSTPADDNQIAYLKGSENTSDSQICYMSGIEVKSTQKAFTDGLFDDGSEARYSVPVHMSVEAGAKDNQTCYMPVASTVKVVVVPFVTDTDTGTQTITSADLGGLTPKAAICYINRPTALDTTTGESQLSVGFTDGTKTKGFVGSEEDNNATLFNHRGNHGPQDGQIAFIVKPEDGTSEGTAIFDSWTANGIVIDWTTAPLIAHRGVMIFFAGDALEAYVGEVSEDDSDDNSQDVGFNPDMLFTHHSDLIYWTNLINQNWIESSIGFVIKDGDNTVYRSAHHWIRDSDNVDDHAVFSEQDIRAFDISTYTWTVTFNDSGFNYTKSHTQSMGFLALKFNDAAFPKLKTVNTPTSTGNFDIGFGLKPEFVWLYTGYYDSTPPAVLNDTWENCAWGFSMVTDSDWGSDAWYTSLGHERSSDPMQTFSRSGTANLVDLLQDDGSTQGFLGSHSFTGGKLRINFATTMTDNSRKWIAFAICLGTRAVSTQKCFVTGSPHVLVYLRGSEDTTDSQSTYMTGQITDSQNCYLSGTYSADSQDAYLKGTSDTVIAMVQVTANQTSGTQDITTTDLNGLTPKGAIFWASRASQKDTEAPRVLSQGWTDGVEQVAQSWAWGTRHFTDVIYIYDSPDDVSNTLAATFDSFITDGVRIDWNDTYYPDSSDDEILIKVLFFAGADVNCDADIVAMPTTPALGTFPVTYPGFTPDIIFSGMVTNNDPPAIVASSSDWILGYAINDGSETQVSFGAEANYKDDTGGAAFDEIILKEDYFLYHPTGASWMERCKIDSFDASGFTVYYDTTDTARYFVYFCVELGAGYIPELKIADVPSGTGLKRIETGNVTPEFAQILASWLTAPNTSKTLANTSNYSLSTIVGRGGVTTSHTLGIRTEYDADPVVFKSFFTDDAFLLRWHDGSDEIKASWDSWWSHGMWLNFSNNVATSGYKALVLTIGEAQNTLAYDNMPAFLHGSKSPKAKLITYLNGAVGGTPVDDNQIAFLWGSDNVIDNQLAYINALDTDLDNQLAYLNGIAGALDQQLAYLNAWDTGLDNQTAYLAGSLDDLDNQLAFLYGSINVLSDTDAYAKGLDTDLDNQITFLSGSINDLDNQLAYLQGWDTALDNQITFLAGGIIVTDDTLTYLKGQDDSTSSSLAYLNGGVIEIDNQIAYLNAWDTGLDSQPAFLNGGIEVNDNQLVYLQGWDTDQNSQLAFLDGQDDALDNQLAYLSGIEGAEDNQVTYLKGQDTAIDSQIAWLAGGIEVNDNQLAYLEGGSSLMTDNQLAYLSGQDTGLDNQIAFLWGQDTANDSQLAFLFGQLTSSQLAFLAGGINVSSDTVCYLVGQDTTLGDWNAYAKGLDTDLDSQLAYLDGQDTGLSDILAFLEGISTELDSQTAYLNGSDDAKDNQLAYLFGNVAVSSSTGAWLWADQYEELVPDGDTAVNSWLNEAQGSTLWPSIDEWPFQDSDYVYFDDPSGTEYFEVSLTDPEGDTDPTGIHTIIWRAGKLQGDETVVMKCELYEISTLIATDQQTITSSFQTFEYNLTQGEVDNISNYDNLRLRFTVVSVT